MKLFKVILKIIGAVILGIGLYFIVFVLIGVQAYLPHQRITIRVPYDLNDAPEEMIPMGETINHPKPRVPHGHPGIDFQYNGGAPHNVIASADGVVTSMDEGASWPEKWDIEIRNGVYLLRYKEMDDHVPGLQVGSKVKEGDVIGRYGIYKEKDGNVHEEIHWEFASVSLIKDRFCPMAYFNADSLKSINALWARVLPTDNQNMKQQFPDICSGDYAGHDEDNGFHQ